MVVLTSLWPSGSCTMRMSVPDCRKCVANLWRRVQFSRCQHHRNALSLRRATNGLQPGEVLIQHPPIQKKQCVQRLPVGSGRYLALVGQHSQEGLNLGFTHVVWVAHLASSAVPADEKLRPVQVNLFGLKAIVEKSNPFANLIKQANRLQSWHGDFLMFVRTAHSYSILRQDADFKQLFRCFYPVLSDSSPL